MEQRIKVIGKGFQDCSDMHSWGPGVRQCYILHYVVSGEGYLKVHDKVYQVREKECFLIWPYTVVYYYPEKTNPWSYLWIDFEGCTNMEAYGFTRDNPVRRLRAAERFQKYFAQMQELDIWKGNKKEAIGILESILGIFQDECSLPGEVEDERIERIVSIIEANYYKSEFGVEMLCELMNMNRVTLLRLFKRRWNTSPCQYISNYRIEQAARLLEMENNVTTTALSCGFADPLYFSKVYKKKMGYSPSKKAVMKEG